MVFTMRVVRLRDVHPLAQGWPGSHVNVLSKPLSDMGYATRMYWVH